MRRLSLIVMFLLVVARIAPCRRRRRRRYSKQPRKSDRRAGGGFRRETMGLLSYRKYVSHLRRARLCATDIHGRPRLAASGSGYNYEGLDTGSAWVGYNFSFGKEPHVGRHADAWRRVRAHRWRRGRLRSDAQVVEAGVVHGRRIRLRLVRLLRQLLLHVVELSIYPVDWLRFGLVVQRTRDYETDFDIQHGLLVGVTYKQLNVTA